MASEQEQISTLSFPLFRQLKQEQKSDSQGLQLW
jgi:hypothetical protein